MNETTIQITVSGDNAAETLEKITSQIPQSATIVTEQSAGPSLEALFQSAMRASPELPQDIADWGARFGETSTFGPFVVVLICIGLIVLAYLGERVASRFLPSERARTPSDAPSGIARTNAALRHGFSTLVRLVIFFGIVRVGFTFAFSRGGEALELASAVLATVMLVRVWYAIIETLAAPNAPERRPTGLTDAEVAQVMRATFWVLVVMALSGLAREFVLSVVEARESGAFFAVVTRAISAIAISVYFIAVRKPMGRLILLGFTRDGDQPGLVLRMLARFWPVLYILFQVLQLLAESRGYLTGRIGLEADALKRSFGALVLAPFIFAGLQEWGTHLSRRAKDPTGARLTMGLMTLLEGVLAVCLGIFILYAWDIDPFATDLTGARRIVPGLVSAAIIGVIGFSLWRTAMAFLDAGSAAPAAEEGEVPDGEGGVAGSRIETVLPVLRAVLGALIGTVTVLLALSAMGVQIAPLLAGAGILGLAIGFGAQKVVEDVISGVLYLVEDAFRKGEYIETSQGKGIVEAIMLRSVRLRHHLGPVFTIPFSAMGTIQNHSRDWVTVKLKFEVSPDQDLEKVRKLIKKVGEQLLEDPELEGQFLAPLKSQGAIAMIGSNYQIGVKFTSEPGKQFLIRRKALNAIQKAFRENNIEMAAPRVIVDSVHEVEAAAAKKLMDARAEAQGT